MAPIKTEPVIHLVHDLRQKLILPVFFYSPIAVYPVSYSSCYSVSAQKVNVLNISSLSLPAIAHLENRREGERSVLGNVKSQDIFTL